MINIYLCQSRTGKHGVNSSNANQAKFASCPTADVVGWVECPMHRMSNILHTDKDRGSSQLGNHPDVILSQRVLDMF